MVYSRSWRAGAALAIAFCLMTTSHAEAAFHLWEIKEVFTSADGAVQFIEFFTTSPNEAFLNGHDIVITSDGVAKTVTFNGHLSGSTANKHFLLATAGFGSIVGGVTPDYTPTSGNLFNPNAMSISFNFAHGWDILEVAGNQIPRDGVNSLHDADTTPEGSDVLSAGPNSPTNFAGQVGSVNLGGGGTPIPGDFNGNNVVDAADLTVWRNNFGRTGSPTPSQGNADGDGDVDGRDLLVWQRNLGDTASRGAVGPIPEPGGWLLMGIGAAPWIAVAKRGRKTSA